MKKKHADFFNQLFDCTKVNFGPLTTLKGKQKHEKYIFLSKMVIP